MSKAKNLLELAMEQTTANTVKSRSGSGRLTYLDRFVSALLDENGQPTDPKGRIAVISEISLAIVTEADPTFDFSTDEMKEEFAKINNRVKAQVNAAISDSQNSTSLSFNEKYKDVWAIVKGGNKMVSLVAKGSEEAAE